MGMLYKLYEIAHVQRILCLYEESLYQIASKMYYLFFHQINSNILSVMELYLSEILLFCNLKKKLGQGFYV